MIVNLETAGIESEDIINFLKQEQNLQDIIVKIVSQQIIKKVAEEKNIRITLEEIQLECDRFRSEHHLEPTADLITWLVDQGIFYEDWEQNICDRLMAEKLSAHLFNQQVEEYFIEHQQEFEQLLFYQIIVPFERIARDLFYQIEEQEFSFFEAAHLYDIDRRRRLTCGYEGWIPVSELQPELIDTILNANLGELIGPLKTEVGYHLLLVEEISEAQLTPEVRKKIVNKLFEDWLKVEVNYRLQKSQSQEINNQTIKSFSSIVKMTKK